MKRWMQHVREWKTAASLSYTASVLIWACINLLCGQTQAPVAVLFELMLLCGVGALLQYVAFTDAVIRKMRYSLRILAFTVPFGALTALCAAAFGWVPRGQPLAWAIFFAAFALILGVITAGFECYYRLSGRRYDGLLGEYRAKRERGPQG